MNRKILSIFAIFVMMSSCALAHDCHRKDIPPKPSYFQQKKMDNLIAERLQLTQEQQNQLKKNRAEQKKEMEKIIKEMNKKHEAIRNIYLTGIPKFQADIKSAPYKAELVVLKQNANKLRQNHRKSFESILTKEQKAEFEVLKKELAKNHPCKAENNQP